MKLCEYENIRCCYCGEDREGKLVNVRPVAFNHVINYRDDLQIHEGPGHFVRCESCSGEFIITCED